MMAGKIKTKQFRKEIHHIYIYIYICTIPFSMVYNLTHAVQEFQIQKSKEGFERTVDMHH